jgi:CopG family transcriptional regulator / antitoxin EndoAI
MEKSKRLIANLSGKLCEEFDRVLQDGSEVKCQFMQEVMVCYEEMKNGYIEMAELNIEISEMCCAGELSALKEYETKLSESDNGDGNGSETRRHILC